MTLINIYNFKKLFLQIENCNTNIQKPHKLKFLGTKRHHQCYKASKKHFLQNRRQDFTQHTSSKEVASVLWTVDEPLYLENKLLPVLLWKKTGELKIAKDDLPFTGKGLQTTKTRGLGYWKLSSEIFVTN